MTRAKRETRFSFKAQIRESKEGKIFCTRGERKRTNMDESLSFFFSHSSLSSLLRLSLGDDFDRCSRVSTLLNGSQWMSEGLLKPLSEHIEIERM